MFTENLIKIRRVVRPPAIFTNQSDVRLGVGVPSQRIDEGARVVDRGHRFRGDDDVELFIQVIVARLARGMPGLLGLRITVSFVGLPH